ncbi:ankyrin repeat-containing domain protein [Mycena floridula]|nr:ankyrin repeat-containing domain protein [Mycena floridula]
MTDDVPVGNPQPGPVLHDGPISESLEPLIAASVASKEHLTPVRKATHQPMAVHSGDPRPQGKPDKKMLGITQFQSSYSGNRTYDYEEKYAPDPLGDQAKPNARVWKVYLDESESYDEDMLRSFRDTIDALLVFAALFSGVVTTLLVQTSQAFQPDYLRITTLLLTEQIQLLRAAGNVSAINTVPSSLADQQLWAGKNTVIWINALFIASLSLSLATALLSVLVKQWLQAYASVIQGGSAMERALIRQFRITGLENWKVPEIIGVLPLILHASLAAFFVGLALFVKELHHSFFWIVVSVGTATFSAYFGSIILPAIWIQCPYRITVLFVPAQYLLWPGKVVKYLFGCFQYRWREWRDPGIALDDQPLSPSISGHTLRDAEHQVIKATGDDKQWKSSTTVCTMGDTISWLHTLESNTSIMNITTQSIFGMMKYLKAHPYLDHRSIYFNMALPISSMFDVAWNHLLDHANIQLPTLTEHQKQNEEIYLELVDGLLELEPTLLLKEPQSQKLATGMFQAASHGRLSLLKQFVKCGADLNATDKTDWPHSTALYKAAEDGHLEVVQFILEHGVDVNARAGVYRCGLAAAAAHSQIKVVEYLLNHGADPNAHDSILFYAVYGGLQIAELVIDKGADLQVQGEAALEIASKDGKLDIVKLLIEKGVSPKKEIILQRACYQGRLEVVRVLFENGADVNALGGNWGTALRAAIDGEERGVVQFLIASGADVNATGGELSTPLQLAIRRRYKEIEDILRRHGGKERLMYIYSIIQKSSHGRILGLGKNQTWYLLPASGRAGPLMEWNRTSTLDSIVQNFQETFGLSMNEVLEQC